MIGNTGRDPRMVDDPVSDDTALSKDVGIDRGPQLLRLLTTLARFGMDPMAPALLEQRCAAPT